MTGYLGISQFAHTKLTVHCTVLHVLNVTSENTGSDVTINIEMSSENQFHSAVDI